MSAKKSQSQRFREAARDIGCDESGAAFERAFKKIVPPKRGAKKSAKAADRRKGA